MIDRSKSPSSATASNSKKQKKPSGRKTKKRSPRNIETETSFEEGDQIIEMTVSRRNKLLGSFSTFIAELIRKGPQN